MKLLSQKKINGESKEIKQKWKGQKKLSVSLKFLVPMTKVLFLEGRLGTRLCLQLV